MVVCLVLLGFTTIQGVFISIAWEYGRQLKRANGLGACEKAAALSRIGCMESADLESLDVQADHLKRMYTRFNTDAPCWVIVLLVIVFVVWELFMPSVLYGSTVWYWLTSAEAC